MQLVHNPKIQDECGDTCAMLWIKNRKTIPPKSLLHESSFKNDDNKSLFQIWNTYGRGTPEDLINALHKIKRYETPKRKYRRCDNAYYDKLSYYNTDKVYREYEKRDMPIQAHYNDSMYSLLTMKSNKIFIKRQDKINIIE